MDNTDDNNDLKKLSLIDQLNEVANQKRYIGRMKEIRRLLKLLKDDAECNDGERTFWQKLKQYFKRN